ncbi:Hypothetical protein A7982_01188 [Minicystis rosea]|nr:Hypothetical protein A7982_01188 [Minicystis rosea]
MKERTAEFDGARVIRTALVFAAVGALVVVLGAFVDVRRLAASYLAAWSCAVCLAVGALVLLLSCHAMRAGWPIAVRRLLETMVAPLPLLAVLFLPIIPALPMLFPWVHPEQVADEHARHVIEHKAAYLNPGFFVVRAAIYFAIWIGLAAVLRRWSFEQDRAPREGASEKMYVLSGFALPVVAITIVFSSFDWLMSVEATWYSTMFPVYVFATGFVGALALLTSLAYAAQRSGYLPGLDASHYYALGRLLLAFTIFWAYAAFFQFMIIWMANKPDEVAYFLDRWEGPWRAPTMLLVFARFIVPFILLMPYRIKRRPRQLTGMAIWIIVATYIDVHWLVIPALHRRGFPYHWLDFATLALVGGLSVAFAAWRLRGRPIVPIQDPRIDEAFAYRSV